MLWVDLQIGKIVFCRLCGWKLKCKYGSGIGLDVNDASPITRHILYVIQRAIDTMSQSIIACVEAPLDNNGVTG